MSRSAQNKALSAEESACSVCGATGGHAPGCWVGQAVIDDAPAEETTTTEDKTTEDKDEE